MTGQTYNTPAARIGNLKGAILKHAEPKEVLGITGTNHEIGQNQSDTITFRRWLPTGATASQLGQNDWSVTVAAHLTQEGVTRSPERLTPFDIPVTLNQYSCLFMYTDKTQKLYEDDVPKPMKKICGQRMGLVREMIRYGTLKGCTNKFYSGGTARGSVDEPISLAKLRAVSKSILGDRGEMITEVLAAGPDFNTTSVEESFLVFAHTDCENDIRELPGFKSCAEYGSGKKVHKCELGAVDRYRFILSPELAGIPDVGGSVTGTGMVSTSASLCDVYPYIIVGEDAWGDVALKGEDSFDVTHLPPGKKDKADPQGQRGYIGSLFFSASFMQNDGWAAVVECAVTDL